MAILRKRGVMRNFLIEAETSKPAPRKVHAQLLHKLALTADSVQIANQQNAQQELRIDGWTTSFAVAVLQPLAHKTEVDMLINQTQQMIFRNLIFQSEVIKQRFRARVLTHHERWSSDNGDPQHHCHTMLPSTPFCHTDFMKISKFVLTFSTPTPVGNSPGLSRWARFHVHRWRPFRM